MNQATLRELTKQGLTQDADVRLEFFYDAPGQAEAEQLQAFLFRETDYTLKVVEEKQGPLRRKSYGVAGVTRLTKVSPQILDQWVDWMAKAGAVKGGCRFDGWGLRVDRPT